MDNSVKYRQKLFEDFEESLFRLAVFDASEKEGECAGAEMTESELERHPSCSSPDSREPSGGTGQQTAPAEPKEADQRQLAASAAVLLLVFLVSVFTVDAVRWRCSISFSEWSPNSRLSA
jgi:hypothetical protein